jgi:hypothetical protein
MKFFILILLSLVFVWVNCNPNRNLNKLECLDEENFDYFYFKFHMDSSYQISRIKFPLKSHIVSSSDYNPDSSYADTIIEREDWVINTLPDFDTSIYSEEKLNNDSIITHRIYIKDSGFEVKRVFKLISCKWFLIFYEEIDF